MAQPLGIVQTCVALLTRLHSRPRRCCKAEFFAITMMRRGTLLAKIRLVRLSGLALVCSHGPDSKRAGHDLPTKVPFQKGSLPTCSSLAPTLTTVAPGLHYRSSQIGMFSCRLVAGKRFQITIHSGRDFKFRAPDAKTVRRHSCAPDMPASH